jgi:chromosome partitioning protein
MSEGKSVPRVRVIVIANEKGGSGKSTVAIHVAVALLKAGNSVASIDLDARQRSFTSYIDNRLAWSRQQGIALLTPTHVCFDEDDEFSAEDGMAEAREEFTRTLHSLTENHGIVVIDTPGHKDPLVQLAHASADTLITPLNDSFVDLNVLGKVDPQTFEIISIGHYARLVETARKERQSQGKSDIDWIVLRNRLSMLSSRNKISNEKACNSSGCNGGHRLRRRHPGEGRLLVRCTGLWHRGL